MTTTEPLRRPGLRLTANRARRRAWRHGAPAAPTPCSAPTTRWAGRLIVLYGAAHTVGALTALGAAHHTRTWFSGQLSGQDLAPMSPAMSAYWLSLNSFGPPHVLLGLTVLWMDRRGITPPTFIGWALGAWTVIGVVAAGPGIGQDLILLVACGLLVAGARRTQILAIPVPRIDDRP